MMHLQAQRNLEVFLQRTGVRHYQPDEVMSFIYPENRLDLAFRHGALQMTASLVLKRDVKEDAFYKLMARAGKTAPGAGLRIYCAQLELGINGVLPDTSSAETWLALYKIQQSLLKHYLTLTL